MSSLRQKLAQHGFESNEIYDFQVRSLLNYRADKLRALNIEGDPGRRKTAFATALARALDYAQVLYHDFTQQHDPLPPVLRPESRDEDGRQEPPIDAFDRIMSDACAFSEGSKTIIIIDQLQAADFREHIRLYNFIKSTEWRYRDACFYANRHNLLIFLISEEPLYHSLQKASFRLWVNAASLGKSRYCAADFALGPEAESLMQGLGDLFLELGVQPTHSEYQHLLHDIQNHVRTSDELSHAIYGWTEGIVREQLHTPGIQNLLKQLMPAVETFIGIDHLEISADGVPDV